MDSQAAKFQSYKQIFRAFSTLSDAQELIAMGSPEQANDLINKAKAHLTDSIAPAGDPQDMELYSRAMFEVSLGR